MAINHFRSITKQLIRIFLLMFVTQLSWAKYCYDAIIIGAGVAGLTTANHLMNSQQNVLIIEAKNRLGGRVYTNYKWGFATDLGASWIHGIDNNPLLPLIGSRSLVKNSYNNSRPTAMLSDFALYDSKGKPVSKQDLKMFSDLASKFQRFCQKQSKMLSFAHLFTIFAQQEHLNDTQCKLLYYALDNIYTYEFADNLAKLSRNTYSVYETSTASGKNALLPEGYFQIFHQFAQHIPIYFHQTVRQIDYGKEEVKVVTQNNTYYAKKVIITVSLGVLKSNTIIFNPSLPKDKREAIAKLHMGNYEKLYLLFDKAFWDKDKEWIGMLPAHGEEAFNIFNYYKYTKKPVLIVFTSGKLARDIDKDDLTRWVMQHLRKIYGRDIPNPIKYKRTHWGSDPFTRGSYSYLPINVNKSVITALAKPVAEKLYFAGEATSTSDLSTVHGAYLSGIRAANEVLAHLKHK